MSKPLSSNPTNNDWLHWLAPTFVPVPFLTDPVVLDDQIGPQAMGRYILALLRLLTFGGRFSDGWLYMYTDWNTCKGI